MNVFSSVAKVLASAKPFSKRSPRRFWLAACIAMLLVGGIGAARLGAQSVVDPVATPEAVASEAEPPQPPLEEPAPAAARPASETNAPAPPTATNLPSSPFAAPPPPPAPTPPLRAGDVAFPKPATQNDAEPIVAIGRPVGRANYGGDGNRKAAQLRSMPPENFSFDRALLRDVLRALAEKASLPYIGIPENSPQALQMVTSKMTASPFSALESLARQYRIQMSYEDGVWFMTLPDSVSERHKRLLRIQDSRQENELVAVMYQLRHDSPDRVDFLSNLMLKEGGSNAEQQVVQPGVQGAATLALQKSQKVFAHRVPRLVNDVRAIVGLPPLLIDEKTGEPKQTNEDEGVGGAIVDYDDLASQARAELEGKEMTTLMMTPGGPIERSGEPIGTPGTSKGIGLKQPDSLTPMYVPPERPQVIYNSDQNYLWVVATRKQQKWVAEFLSKVDKPQELIAIEVKFLETKRNPQIDLGVNWAGTFQKGITVSGRGFVGEEGGLGRIVVGSENGTSSVNGGVNTVNALNGGANAASVADAVTGSPVAAATAAAATVTDSQPYGAVLSVSEVSATLQAFMQDRDSSVVQYPRVLTLNNREVAITSSENTPLNIGTQTTGNSTGGQNQTVAALGYLPTGTQINILPKVVSSNQIAMTVAITVSTITGELPLNLGTGVNLYPITSGRVFNASLQVNSGYTLAVGGLEKVDDSDVVGGIPVLKDIPGLGYLFKNKNKRRNKVNLIIFITPYLIGDPANTPGISETPRSILPVRPGSPPEAPVFTPDGRLSGGSSAVEGAFRWLEFQLRYFRQVNLEAMMNLDSVQKLKDVIGVARALLADLQLQAGQPPYDPEMQSGRDAILAEEILTDLNRALANAQDNLM